MERIEKGGSRTTNICNNSICIFIYMFYKMIKDNETSYVILIIMQAFGIVLNFIEIIQKYN